MCLARFAKFKEEIVSLTHEEWFEQVTIKEVLKLPPKDSYSILVNFESR